MQFIQKLFLLMLSLVFGVGEKNSSIEAPSTDKIIREFDLNRYLGDWYEIARSPNWFERKCVSDIKANYSKLSDDEIVVMNSCCDDTNRCQSVTGIGVKTALAGWFRVTFAPKWLRAFSFVWADYCVYYVDENYQQAIVGDRSGKYLWFLSRTSTIAEDDFLLLEQIALSKGFSTAKLIRTNA